MIENKTFAILEGAVGNFPLYVFWCDPQIDTRAHTHSFVELVLILTGSSNHCCGGQIRKVSAGNLFVIPRELPHAYAGSTPDFTLANIIFQPEELPFPQLDATLLHGFRAAFHGRAESGEKYPFLHLDDRDFNQIHELFLRMRQEDENRQPGYRFALLGYFMTLLCESARLFTRQSGQKPQVFLRTSDVISYISRHFRETCDYKKLCQIAGMSRSSLRRYFLNTAGCSPARYQLQLRISEAAALLRSTKKNIDEIAAETGFGDRNYFSRQFKKETGHPPAEYRRLSAPEPLRMTCRANQE